MKDKDYVENELILFNEIIVLSGTKTVLHMLSTTLQTQMQMSGQLVSMYKHLINDLQ